MTRIFFKFISTYQHIRTFHHKKNEVFSGIRSMQSEQQRREQREQKEFIEGFKSSFEVRNKRAFKKTAETQFMNKFDDSIDEQN